MNFKQYKILVNLLLKNYGSFIVLSLKLEKAHFPDYTNLNVKFKIKINYYIKDN